MMTVLLEYILIVHYNFSQMLDIAILQFPVILVLCLMLSMTYYAQNYAEITGGSLGIKCIMIQPLKVALLSMVINN